MFLSVNYPPEIISERLYQRTVITLDGKMFKNPSVFASEELGVIVHLGPGPLKPVTLKTPATSIVRGKVRIYDRAGLFAPKPPPELIENGI